MHRAVTGYGRDGIAQVGHFGVFCAGAAGIYHVQEVCRMGAPQRLRRHARV